MKSSDFTKFFNLVEDREPVFKEALVAANGMVKGGFLDHVPYAEMTISHPQNLLSSPLSSLNFSEGTEPVLPGRENKLWTGDAYSGPDLDALLSYSFREAAEHQRPNNIFAQCHLWQSTRFDDPEGIDELPSWFPRLQRSQRRPRRYQMLPFYDTKRWQLAVFDLVNNVTVCYDTMWTFGSPNSTFVVGQALCAYSGFEADLRLQSLQQWFNATVGNAQGTTFDCHHEKVCHYDKRFAGH